MVYLSLSFYVYSKMQGLTGVFILVNTFVACHSFSISDLLLKARDSETDGASGKSPPQKWNDFSIPSMNGSFVNLQIDMLMTLEEANQAYTQRNFGRGRRSAVKDRSKLWPRRIPYHIDDAFDASQKLVIMKAMQQWTQFTCLKFVPKQQRDFNYIKFVFEKDVPGCLSFVGMQNMPQSISLSRSCLHEEIVLHEIGHAIGLFHEHNRPDRDSYVTVKWENIAMEDQMQFDEGNWATSDNYSAPYDYTSIMHYSSDVFSKTTGAHTMVPTNESFLNIMGQSKTISFYDAMTANNMYRCSDGCKTKICPRHGYLGPGCVCYCPGDEGEEPVKLCTDRVYCDTPKADETIYGILDADSRRINDITRDFFNGTQIIVRFEDHERCGYTTTIQTCINGSWAGVLPKCKLESCVIPKMWKPKDGEGFEKETVLHGTNLSVVCRSSMNTKLVICDNGTYKDVVTGGISDVATLDCSPFYRIINDEGRSCKVQIKPEARYTVTQDDERVQNGHTVKHLSHVIAACDDMYLNNTVLMREMVCKDGRWNANPPEKCPAVRKACALVTHAIVEGPLDIEAQRGSTEQYSVNCITGYTRNTLHAKFTCTFDGDWLPKQPECFPDTCIVPNHYKDNVTKGRSRIFRGEEVSHGQTVTIECPAGHVVDVEDVTCHLGEWTTGSLPTCRKVTCAFTSSVPIVGVTIKAKYRRPEYIYGDNIKLRRCPKNLEKVGPQISTCQRNGEWSGIIECREYCKNGKSEFKKEKREGKMISKSPQKTEKMTGKFDPERCPRYCRDEKEFLCMSIAYGYDMNLGNLCKLYRDRVQEESLVDDIDWVVEERICVT